MADYDWAVLIDRLGDRQVQRALVRAGGRGSSIAMKSATKVFRSNMPIRSGAMSKGLKSKRIREKGQRLEWKTSWTSDVVYWGPSLNSKSPKVNWKLIRAYESAQDRSRVTWRAQADKQITRAIGELLR